MRGAFDFSADYGIGSRVYIDADESIVGTVIEVSFQSGRVLFQVAWMHGGASHKEYFEPFRLSDAGDRS
jgi:hypothetical protein